MKLSRLLECLDRHPRDSEVLFATGSMGSLDVLSVYKATYRDKDADVVWIDLGPADEKRIWPSAKKKARQS